MSSLFGVATNGMLIALLIALQQHAPKLGEHYAGPGKVNCAAEGAARYCKVCTWQARSPCMTLSISKINCCQNDLLPMSVAGFTSRSKP